MEWSVALGCTPLLAETFMQKLQRLEIRLCRGHHIDVRDRTVKRASCCSACGFDERVGIGKLGGTKL
jgi:hypothetical protein